MAPLHPASHTATYFVRFANISIHIIDDPYLKYLNNSTLISNLICDKDRLQDLLHMLFVVGHHLYYDFRCCCWGVGGGFRRVNERFSVT